ncbi:MAG: zinc ribbon domain-containing protein [Acutalibacteraceae bacterium]|nr:zinc ribbon domain-containing protein [Acutalibacteraceae bacterium]
MTTKLCDFCGKEIPENSKICPYCNKALVDKVFTYMNEPKTNETSRLNVSKYTAEEKDSSDNYFNSNIYSFSETEIEKRFERKPISYEEEEPKQPDETFHIQREETNKTATIRQRKKQKNLLYPIIGILVVLIVVICVIGFALSGTDNNKPEEEITATQTTTTTAQTTTTTVAETTTTEATTTTENYISTNSVDLDGYLGVGFDGISADFGEQTQESSNDEFYGGKTYYYDGMTVSTDESSRIASMTIDYTSVKNKDTYRYQKITYYSTYNHVIDELGEPDLDQMNDATEPCIGYTIDEGSGLSIKFKFDDNKKVSGFDIFYAD